MRKLCFVTVSAIVAAALFAVLVNVVPTSTDDAEAGASTITMSIDAIPGNGTRPCDPIDNAATVALNSSHSVAICIADYLAVAGEAPPAFEARVVYNTLNTAPEVADVAPAVDDNPNLNNTAGPNGVGTTVGAGGWDCTSFGQAFPKGEDPNTPERDAFIFCNTGGTSALAANPGHLATINFNTGSTSGTDPLTFGGSTNVFAENCGLGVLVCVGATITKGTGGGVPPTPTVTNTPAPGTIPTQGAGSTATPTVTPEGAGGETPPPGGGETPGPGEPGEPGQPGGQPTAPGGGPGGVVQPPSTGSGGDSSVDTRTLILAAAAIIGGVGLTGAGWRLRRSWQR
jgi:hypothetical protein